MMEKRDGRFRRAVAGESRGAGGASIADISKGGSRRGLLPLSVAAAIFSLAALYLHAHPERAGLLESRIRALRVTSPFSPEDSPVLAAQGIAGINPLADPFSGGTRDCALSLSLETGTRVFIDGEFLGTAPISGVVRLAPGKHLVELRRTGFAGWSGEVYLRSGETLDFTAPMSPL
ncbi:MAG: PEGA domain-containing protein [Candidatus Krumholzibacteria bacterium]|jgi:hypothetical protein|nr:PEGA domain-containing protein [Candidatus Krumholzibacteria bacterium]